MLVTDDYLEELSDDLEVEILVDAYYQTLINQPKEETKC